MLKKASTLLSTIILALTSSFTDFSYDISGESRIRYETLYGQFRSGKTGSDQLLPLRTLLRADLKWDRLKAVIEIHDARTYLDDDGTPLSTSFVNTHDLLQGYLQFPIPKLNYDSELKVGRFTLDIASRRFVERNDFRNTINSYSGFHSITKFKDDMELNAFYVLPVDKNPTKADTEGLDDNDFAWDEENRNRTFWAFHLQDIPLVDRLLGDIFVYGLDEKDKGADLTEDRNLTSPGFRLRMPKEKGKWDFDLEAAYRTGTQSASAVNGAARYDVEAHMLHIDFGYTFETDWNWRLGLEYDLASGDDDPTDDKIENYERLYGTRRGDLGNTSIYGPLTRSNISVPGIRLSFKKGRWDGRFILQRFDLDSGKDAWVVAKLQDTTGNSGTHVGDTFDFRVRYWVKPKHLRAEVGASYLEYGEFSENVPGGPSEDHARFGYVMMTGYF